MFKQFVFYIIIFPCFKAINNTIPVEGKETKRMIVFRTYSSYIQILGVGYIVKYSKRVDNYKRPQFLFLAQYFLAPKLFADLKKST